MGKPVEETQLSQSIHATQWGPEPQASPAWQSGEYSMDVVQAKLLRKMVGEDEKRTSKSKVDLARLPPCHSALKSLVQCMIQRVALYKRADEPILD